MIVIRIDSDDVEEIVLRVANAHARTIADELGARPVAVEVVREIPAARFNR